MSAWILFDLDGTLTDSGEGVMKSVRYALDRMGFPDEPESALRRFIGPPLHKSFMDFYGFSEERRSRPWKRCACATGRRACMKTTCCPA